MTPFTRQGSGRPLVLLHSGLSPQVIEALAARFEVFSCEPKDAAGVRAALEHHRIERPLLFAVGAAVDIACAVAGKRMPRGVVLVGTRREVSAPLFVVTPEELVDAAPLAERVAAFDAPLE